VAMTAAVTGERLAKQTRARAATMTGGLAAPSGGARVNPKRWKATEPTIESPRTLTMKTRYDGVNVRK
jgi:hypothetical protein